MGRTCLLLILDSLVNFWSRSDMSLLMHESVYDLAKRCPVTKVDFRIMIEIFF
jgi:hypothetical protein